MDNIIHNMNPQLMKLIALAEERAPEVIAADRELQNYNEYIRFLDTVDFKDPNQQPWQGETNGHIKMTRALVGHIPINPPVATAVVLDDNMRILLECRSDDNKWSIPGGVVKPGESIKECAINDIRRETGLLANPDNLYLFEELSGNGFHYYPNGDILDSAKIVYVAKRCEGELIVNYENLALKYFDLQSIPSKVSGSTRKIVSHILDRYDEVKEW